MLLQLEQLENSLSQSERSAKTAGHKNERGAGSVDVAVRSWAQRTAELSQQVLEIFRRTSLSIELPEVGEDAGTKPRTAKEKLSGPKPKVEKKRTPAKKASKKAAQKKWSKKEGTSESILWLR